MRIRLFHLQVLEWPQNHDNIGGDHMASLVVINSRKPLVWKFCNQTSHVVITLQFIF